jgi:rSAM/selenodomain-associated transferase 1
MRPARTILVFVKFPEPGRVKTRLAQTIGMARAAEMYRAWIGQVFGKLQALRSSSRLIGYYDGAPIDEFAAWEKMADDWWAQPDGDLGQRLAAGFEAGFALGGPVIALGTDCLEIDPELVLQAFQELAWNDVVFGPASDGGYYLVGAAQSRPNLFDRIRWSSPFTLTDHLRRCEEERWSKAILPMRHDIDTWDDWNAYLVRTGQLSVAR